MLLNKYFIIILLSLSVSYASEDGTNDSLQNNLDCISNEGNSCEVKLAAALSLMKTEILHSHRRMDEMWKTKHDLEDSIDGKFHKLEKNILDKLVEYIEGKLDSLDKLINRKVDALEKNIPDKIDIAIIKSKFDGLNKIQTDLDENKRYETKSRFEENINLKLNNIDGQILNITEKLNHTMKQISYLVASKDTIKKVLPNITHGYWKCKERTVKNVHDFQLIRLDNDTLNYVTLESDEIGLAHFEMRFAAKGTVVHIQLSPVQKPKKDEGYFLYEIYKTWTTTYMSRPATDDARSINYVNSVLKQFTIPALLLKDVYTAFYIKIKNQTLEVGKEGSDAPILKYTDSRFRTVQYIGLTSYPGHETTYLYDCPPHFAETIF